jgi:hypothetical protein
MEVSMREIAIVFICFSGLMVVSLWAFTITLAITSGRNIFSRFSRQSKRQWLSIPDTIAEYSDEHTFPGD